MNADLREIINMSDLRGDPWGTAIATAFGICEVLNSLGDEIPAGLGYSHGASVTYPVQDIAVGEEFPGNEIATLYCSVGISTEELQWAAKVLDRYLDWCRLAGKDY